MVLGVLGALVGCSKPPPPPEEPVVVVASVYALGDIVRQVGGDHVKVEWLIESGDPLGPLEDTPERRRQLSRAGLVVTRGQLDAWTGFVEDRRIIRIDTLPAARSSNMAHFLWLDPRIALELAHEVAARLGALDPRHAERFRANAAAFSRQVAELTEQTTIRINRHGGGAFAALDPRFMPLARRFGLAPVKLPEVRLNDPAAYNAQSLRRAAEKAGASAFFIGSDTPFPVIREWEARLQMPVLPLAMVGSSSAAGHTTYLDLLRHNLEQLAAGTAPVTRSTTAPTSQPVLDAPPKSPQASRSGS